MSHQRIAGVDGAGCIRRLELLPMEGGHAVLLKITGSRPMAIELDLSQLMDLRMEAAIAHLYALDLQAQARERETERRAA